MSGTQGEVRAGQSASGPRLRAVLPALAAAGRTFVLAALFLVTLDAGVCGLSTWPSSTFPSWAGNRVNERIYRAVIERGERLYGKEGWFERTIPEESTIAFQMALLLKLRLVLLASLLAALVAGLTVAVRGAWNKRSGERADEGAASRMEIPLSVLVLALMASVLPCGASAGMVGYLVAGWQRRGPGPLPRGRRLLLAGFELLCAGVVVTWAVAAQIPWGAGWSMQYPLLYRIGGGG